MALVMMGPTACGSKSDTKADEVTIEVDQIQLPGHESGPRTKGALDDPRMHLQPDEGTLTIDAVKTSAGTEASAIVRVTPSTGFHVSTEIPTTLTLAPLAGVTIAKPRFEAGGGQKGDADEFSDKSLSFVVKARVEKFGTYELHGTFNFGVCRSDSCHSKKQPITITVTAS